MFNPSWSLWSNKIIIARWWNRRSSERCARRSTRQSRRSLMVRAIRREPFSFIHYILNIFSFQWFDWSFRADRLEPSAKLEVGLKDVSLKVEEKKSSELLETEVSFLIKNAFVLVELPCSNSLVQANLGGEKASLSKNIRKQHFLPTTTCLWDWPWPIDMESPYTHIWFSCCVKCLNIVIINGIIKKMMALMMNMATIVISPDSRNLLGKHRQTDTAIQTYTD